MMAAKMPVDGVLTRPLVHGTDPMNLVERILRLRVYESAYWQQYCFAVNAADLVDRATDLEYIGATASETNKPTPFICLLVKMLQISPELAIARAMLENEEFKYMRALAAMYVRMTARPAEVFRMLEPLLADHRKLRVQTKAGWELTTMDDFVDGLLEDDAACSIALPRLALRAVLVREGLLPAERPTVLRDKIANGDLADDASIPSLLDGYEDEDGASSASDASSVPLQEEAPPGAPRAQGAKRPRPTSSEDGDGAGEKGENRDLSDESDSDDAAKKKKKKKKSKKSKKKEEHKTKKHKKKKEKKEAKKVKRDKSAVFIKGLKQH